MRKAFLILLFCFAPTAFSNSLFEWNAKRDSSQWSGYYGGVLFGGQFGRSSDKTGDIGYNADNEEWNYSESGLNTGLEFGYSYPWRNVFLGPEIEVGYLNMTGNGTQPSSPGGDTKGKSSSDLYTSLRVRIGIDVNDYLLFLTGGAMETKYTSQVVDSCSIAPCGGGTVDAYNNSYVFGYTVGGGVEHMIAKNWSMKIEYLYFNLNNQSLNGATNLGNSYNWTAQTYGNIVRGGVSYYFG